MGKSETYKWQFKSRFRRQAFGWRSQPAIQRVREAVSEIKKVARKDPALAAEGAVYFLEHLSPAIEQVDGSSGAMGSAVNHAIEELAKVIGSAPVDTRTREKWLDRLWDAHSNDGLCYLDTLPDYWGELCASRFVASRWADELFASVKSAWRDGAMFHGASACLSALYSAARYDDLLALLELERLHYWPYRRWGAKALAALGKVAEAINYAERCAGKDTMPSPAVACLCEEILLQAGAAEEAYQHYAIDANRSTSHLATFRAIRKKYPHKSPREILSDLIESTPGEEGKWFATAKEAGFFDLALELAASSPCDPRTLTRAARDYAESNPDFATGAGLLALSWLLEGYGYEITSADVWDAYSNTMTAAKNAGRSKEVLEKIRVLLQSQRNAGGFVAEMLRGHVARTTSTPS